MFVKSKSESTRRERNGLLSHILLQKGDVEGSHLSITWVEIAPGSEQKTHRHIPEQVYVITRGKGRMHVGSPMCQAVAIQ